MPESSNKFCEGCPFACNLTGEVIMDMEATNGGQNIELQWVDDFGNRSPTVKVTFSQIYKSISSLSKLSSTEDFVLKKLNKCLGPEIVNSALGEITICGAFGTSAGVSPSFALYRMDDYGSFYDS